MGKLVNGLWQDIGYQTEEHQGEFVREDSQIHHWITATGEAGPSGQGGFKAEAGRYHLYVAAACPWAHRCIIFRVLKQLESVISMDIVHPHMLENGWTFSRDYPDTLNDFAYLHQVYTKYRPDYTGRVTVPVLWDKQQHTIVNNESSQIIRILNQAFNELTGDTKDYYPETLRYDIDRLNDIIYKTVNNGVYRCGFATSQAHYEEAVIPLFTTLDELDQHLGSQRYLLGPRITEADWRLFTTLIRFDIVYFGHFKTNIKRIVDYHNLSNYVRELYQMPGIAVTVNIKEIKAHYYYSHAMINPSRIVPLGPQIDFMAAHDRSRLAKQ